MVDEGDDDGTDHDNSYNLNDKKNIKKDDIQLNSTIYLILNNCIRF